MKKMQASVFKSRCLKVMEHVQKTGEPVIVTKRGKPMVKVVPAKADKDDLFGYMKDDFEIVGDIVSPAATLEEWEILKK